MFYYSYGLGIPISIIYILGRYLYLKNTENIKPDHFLEINQGHKTTINLNIGNTVFNVSENDFLYAEADGNYCTIYYMKNNTLNKELLRISLTSLEEQIHSEYILRCHRSYIVNTNKIIKTKGNAQGYKLNLQHSKTTIPVSRKYIELFKR